MHRVQQIWMMAIGWVAVKTFLMSGVLVLGVPRLLNIIINNIIYLEAHYGPTLIRQRWQKNWDDECVVNWEPPVTCVRIVRSCSR